MAHLVGHEAVPAADLAVLGQKHRAMTRQANNTFLHRVHVHEHKGLPITGICCMESKSRV